MTQAKVQHRPDELVAVLFDRGFNCHLLTESVPEISLLAYANFSIPFLTIYCKALMATLVFHGLNFPTQFPLMSLMSPFQSLNLLWLYVVLCQGRRNGCWAQVSPISFFFLYWI